MLRRIIGCFCLLAAIFLLQGSGGEEVGNTPGTDYREASAKTSSSGKNIKNSAALLETYYANQLENYSVRLRSGSEYTKENFPTQRTSLRCKSIIARVLAKLPTSHRAQLSELTLVYNTTMRRGLGGSNSIVIRCLGVTDSELAAVLVHEMGHLVDADLLFGTDTKTPTGFYDFDTQVPADDASLLFYKLDWVSEKERRADSKECDFASVYGTTDPFEDFAEAYALYVTYGPQFKKLGASCPTFAAKYDFMKTYVFEGKEFGNFDASEQLTNEARNYDVTVLPFSLKKFFEG